MVLICLSSSQVQSLSNITNCDEDAMTGGKPSSDVVISGNVK